MTNIDQMTKEELRLAIAEALGWRVWLRGHGKNIVLPPQYQTSTFALVDGFKLEEVEFSDIDPNWPTSIADAWELVEEMERADVGFSIFNEKHADGKIEYEAIFYDPWGGPAHEHYECHVETAPIAISRAWLKYKGLG